MHSRNLLSRSSRVSPVSPSGNPEKDGRPAVSTGGELFSGGTAVDARPTPSSVRGSTPPSRAHGVSAQNHLPEREIDFAELDDGSLVEAIEDPADTMQTAFAVFKSGHTRVTSRLEYHGQLLVPIPRSAVGFSDVKLSSGVMYYKSVTRLFYRVFSFMKFGIDVPAEYVSLLSAYVLYTWVADKLPTAVYLSLIGLPQSGKSTLLELLSLVCRRPLLVSDISQAALYRSCSRFQPTVLIDEVDWHSSKTTTALRQLLRAGTSRSSRVLRVRESAFSFGPKVFSSLESSSDAALNSRSIQIPMAETHRRDLVKPGNPRMLSFAAETRQQLLQFRFAHYKSIRPTAPQGAEALRPRSRDLLGSLAAALPQKGREIRLLIQLFELRHDPSTKDSLPARYGALLAVLFQAVHTSPGAAVRLGGESGLAAGTNDQLLRAGEQMTVSEKAVGSMLSSMGFHHKQRTKKGWVLWLDSETRQRCHQLVRTHGTPYLEDDALISNSKDCPECKELATAPAS